MLPTKHADADAAAAMRHSLLASLANRVLLIGFRLTAYRILLRRSRPLSKHLPLCTDVREYTHTYVTAYIGYYLVCRRKASNSLAVEHLRAMLKGPGSASS